MTSIKKLVLDIVGDEPISESAIARAISVFRSNYIDRPEILALHPSAYRSIAQQITAKYFNIEAIMGLRLYRDPELAEDEWRVRKEDEKSYALEVSNGSD